MSKNSKNPDSFLQKPIYDGGMKAMRVLIKKNLKYPEQALAQKVEGTVKVRYDIDYKGRVIKTKVIKGIGHGCDEEAERLVKLFEFKINKTRKVRVIYHKNIQIHFKLPAPKAKPVLTKMPNVAMNYVTSPAAAPKETPRKKSYSYTISVK